MPTDEHRVRGPTRDLPALLHGDLPGCRVTISPGLLDSAGMLVRQATAAHRYALIADETVLGLFGDRVQFSFDPDVLTVHTFAPGEPSKTRETWGRITDEMLEAGHGRDSAIVAMGGGVTGDLGGFVAATYMRGIRYVQLPTTLLAMVDASIGGKTGVDIPGGKNLVGAFHAPRAVVIDPLALDTLPLRDRRAAFAEILKHGIIANASYFHATAAQAHALLEDMAHESSEFVELLTRSISIKADVVRRDEREHGLRKILNFGHTIAHGIETARGYEWPHGEAGAIGLAIEAELAEQVGVAEPGTSHAIRTALVAAGLPTELPSRVAAESVLAAARHDKKNRRGLIEFALPRCIGAMAGEDTQWGIAVEDAAVLRALEGA
jgi:3-dehydroquinate synthase